MPDYRTPGVFIEEVPATGPIAGVGTSTAAFVGPALGGPINVPTKVTNWTQYKNTFGEYLATEPLYLPYAVRGFFENGGTVAYVVRVGTAVRASRDLDDQGSAGRGTALRVEAKTEGEEGNTIQVEVKNASLVGAGGTTTVSKALAPIASAALSSIKLQNAADAARFRPFDMVTIDGSSELARVSQVLGDVLVLESNLTARYDNTKFVRIADLTGARNTFRLEDSSGVRPGGMVRLAQAGGTLEDRVVTAVNDHFITLSEPALAAGFRLGPADPDVSVTVLYNAIVARARAAVASASGRSIKLKNADEAAQFRPFDTITIEDSDERSQIERIRGDELVLMTDLAATHDQASFVRIANLIATQKTFRIQNTSGIGPGSVIHLAQEGTKEDRIVDAMAGDFVTLAGSGLANGYSLDQDDPNVIVTTLEFSLFVTRPGVPPLSESFLNLSMDRRHSRYFGRVVKSAAINLTLPRAPSVQPPPGNRPAELAPTKLTGGANDALDRIGLNDYQAALAELERVDDVNLVCAPGRTDAGVQAALVAHCERMLDRFALLDSEPSLPPRGPGSVIEQRAKVTSARGYAALYYPWIWVYDPSSPTGDETLLVPPSGHLAGIYARSDSQRGVHKAPANEFITGALDLERLLNDTEQGELNIEGINALRVFPGQRPKVWGARTTAPKEETPWRYVNVRRLFLFVEESIQEGIRWAVFEPNDRTLWKKLERTLTEFLTRVWRSGSLFGKTAGEAFYVKIDDELNPEPVRALGQIIIEVGIAPVRPAEFVIVRIAMWDGGSQSSET